MGLDTIQSTVFAEAARASLSALGGLMDFFAIVIPF
jgi:hypothetical protein